ncbi:MAG: hypothetical protein PHV78_01440 [Patescibacteria group bacterium]|nr:hypothetical protein [Patescibacteria group bacterium]MDD5121181.1 hypothetical protein [Patescibacteria group bacterium]MDD5221993.1 hypothetical protein [Patescibacteria group bacterium]MDD5395900.1 hypothetical protein [Patescibacteria group bacterium]
MEKKIASMPKSSISKEQILVIILAILILVILALLIKGFVLPRLTQSVIDTEGPKAPAFLSAPLPSLNQIEKALQNPKLDELKFYPLESSGSTSPAKQETLEELARRMKIEKIGRPNPFLPFDQTK